MIRVSGDFYCEPFLALAHCQFTPVCLGMDWRDQHSSYVQGSISVIDRWTLDEEHGGGGEDVECKNEGIRE